MLLLCPTILYTHIQAQLVDKYFTTLLTRKSLIDNTIYIYNSNKTLKLNPMLTISLCSSSYAIENG